jgi:hypothetical protein
MEKCPTEHVAKHLGLTPSSKLHDDCMGGQAVGKMNREINMALNRCQVLPKLTVLMKLSNYSFIHTALANMMNRTC